MKVSIRFLGMAIITLSLVFLAATAGARAQVFPQCNGTEITIKNPSFLPADVCIKGLGCFHVPAQDGIIIPVIPGTEVPGIYGVANTTHEWQPNPNPNFPPLWIPSVQMFPTFRCFDVYYDEATCLILIDQTVGPPCINP